MRLVVSSGAILDRYIQRHGFRLSPVEATAACQPRQATRLRAGEQVAQFTFEHFAAVRRSLAVSFTREKLLSIRERGLPRPARGASRRPPAGGLGLWASDFPLIQSRLGCFSFFVQFAALRR